MVKSVAERLEKAVSDYLLWMISVDYSSGTIKNYKIVLNHFQKFITHRKIEWSDIFTHNTLTAFKKDRSLYHVSPPVKKPAKIIIKKPAKAIKGRTYASCVV